VAGPAAAPLHSERLRVPWTWWPAIALIVVLGVFEVASGFSYVVYVPVTVFLVGFFVVPLLITGTAKISVQDGEVRAGGSSVRVTELTALQALDRTETRLQLGPRADPAAHLVTRGWVATSVLMRLSNPRPTPYWLVSTRHPDALITAIKQERARARVSPKG
jgi:hypothetical protein